MKGHETRNGTGAKEGPDRQRCFSRFRANVLCSCRGSCREPHILPNSLSCFDERKPCREFDGKLTGKKKMGRTQCIRELPGRAEFQGHERSQLPRVSRPPSPNHKGEGGRETPHRGQAISGPAPESRNRRDR